MEFCRIERLFVECAHARKRVLDDHTGQGSCRVGSSSRMFRVKFHEPFQEGIPSRIPDDRVIINLPMELVPVAANPRIAEGRGKVVSAMG
jgi:hypothetical protein